MGLMMGGGIKSEPQERSNQNKTTSRVVNPPKWFPVLLKGWTKEEILVHNKGLFM